MPREALHAGAKLVIINARDTPFDPYAHLRFREKRGEVLPPAVQRLKIPVGVE
jgi:NAD-dependent SIR2 family protein deacetylase